MLTDEFNVHLPATTAFDYPTAAAVAGYISKIAGASSTVNSNIEGALEAYDHMYGKFEIKSSNALSCNTYILGIGCLYPQSEKISDFWQFAEKSGTAQSEIPAQRWDVDHCYDPTISKVNLSYARFAAFISNIDQFDSAAFRMGRAESTALDPQTRMLLQITGDALHGAQSLDPATTGTYVGCMFTDYMDYVRISLQKNHTGPMMTGNGAPYQSGRVAYSYGFQGPCIGIDTACSSSLIATHSAHRGIIGGEAFAAIASGINALLWHETTVGICQLQALSPDGRCKSFEADADGYGRGEGFISLYLSISNIRNDAIGVIRGGAVNQDGRSSSLTSPHGPSQQVLLAKSLRYCSLSPRYSENIAVHGTGTVLGDPIEIGAIQAVFNDSRHLPLALTSVKSCYGHTEGAAGATGLLFALNFASNGLLAPIMCLRNMNPYVASALGSSPQLNFMPRQLSAGPSGVGNAAVARVAGTSSFGMSGVNAHMIVQGAFICPDPAVNTAIWKLQSYWPAPLQTGYIRKFTSRNHGAEAIMELNANDPSCAYLRDHTVAGRIILPGTAVLSCIAIAARYLVGEESSPLVCNTAFISPCNIGADSLQLTLFIFTGAVFFVSGRSNRHASSRVTYSSALAAPLATNNFRANVRSVVLNNREAGVYLPFTSVANLFTHSLKSACMFKGSVEPAESDATLHLSAIQTKTILLPASVAAAASQPVRDGKMSNVKDGWASVAFRLLTESTIPLKSFTDARIVSGGAMLPSSITELESRQASAGNALPFAATTSKDIVLYSMDLESSLPLIVEPKGEEERSFAASAQEETSFSGISLKLDTPPLGIGTILQVLKSQDVAKFSRWNLNTSLQSHAAHGALKVAAREGILSTRHQVVVGELACIAKGAPIDFTAAEIHSSILYTPTLKTQYGQKSIWPASAAKNHQGITLVTGALGGLGSVVSAWAALEKEPQALLLAGRTVHYEKIFFINGISAMSQNSIITIAHANAACREDMSALFSMQPIESIYHTSGTLVDGIIQNQYLSGARKVFAPKVGALERLESNLSCMAVANVALFSSITSLLGTKGQANYAAANAVLDAASSTWEEQGRSRCASIQWGAWSGSGMAASHPSLLKRLQVQGYGSVTPQAGLHAMQIILCALSAPVVVANPFDWTVFLKHFEEYGHLLFGDKEQAADSARESTLVVPAGSTKADARQLRSISKEFVADIILGLVRAIISDEDQNVSLDTPFFEAGLDSIGMVELSNAIVSTFKLEKLSSTVLFDYPSIIDLATHLATLVAAPESAWSGEAERYLPSTSGQATIPFEEVESKLQAIMKDSFGFALENSTTNFSEGGLDSITSVEFQKSVQNYFRLEDFPVTAVFDFPTIELMTAEVLRRLQQQSGALISSHMAFRDELSALHESAIDKQLVVTGMASSFPTAQDQHGSFMETALNGKDTISTIPISKWDVDSMYAVEANTANTSYCRFASVLPISALVSFDCENFRVTKNEAMLMDPHARLLLAHVREAHDDSVANARALINEASTAVGVFVGCMWSNEYMQMLPQLGVLQTPSSAITGNTLPFLAGRVAYNFGWRGPCVPTDTACSSSLVAAHVGRLSMMANECQTAAVGGVNAHLSSTTTIKICALQALSPVGRCKSFDASADGYGRGEGFVVIMLEPARSMHTDNAALAYLASTSVNTAGKSSGLTAPSGPAQRELVVDAIAAAEITPNAVSMVAVHGTGTSLGDPIEIGALCQALELKAGGRDRRGEALVVASVKSCFGHTEGAAGLTGALLAIGALKSQICPSIVNLRNMNPYVASSLDRVAATMLSRQHAAAFVYRNSGLAGK